MARDDDTLMPSFTCVMEDPDLGDVKVTQLDGGLVDIEMGVPSLPINFVKLELVYEQVDSDLAARREKSFTEGFRHYDEGVKDVDFPVGVRVQSAKELALGLAEGLESLLESVCSDLDLSPKGNIGWGHPDATSPFDCNELAYVLGYAHAIVYHAHKDLVTHTTLPDTDLRRRILDKATAEINAAKADLMRRKDSDLPDYVKKIDV